MPPSAIRLHRKVHHLDARVGGTHGTEPLLRRDVSRAGAARTHPLHGQVRRREPAGGDADHGTELNIVQEGVPEMIPPEACYLGWRESLALLAKLVEAEI